MPNPFNYRPDFEAEIRLPEWVQMGGGDNQQMNISPLVDALKKRMTKQPDPNAVSTMMSGSMKSPGSGGMKSL